MPELYYFLGLPVGATVGILGSYIGYHVCCGRDVKPTAYAGVILFTILTGLLVSSAAIAGTGNLHDMFASLPLPSDLVAKASKIGFYITAAMDFFCLSILHGIQQRANDFTPRNLQRELNRRGMRRDTKPGHEG